MFWTLISGLNMMMTEVNFWDAKFESFPSLNDLMIHKKSMHIEKVNFCRYFATNLCIYGDEKCWFVHEPEEEPQCSEFKCLLCKKESNSLSDFIRHRKFNHEESTPIYKQFRTGECTFGNNKCWFIYERDDGNTNIKEGNEKTLENNEIVQKMFKMMENIT